MKEKIDYNDHIEIIEDLLEDYWYLLRRLQDNAQRNNDAVDLNAGKQYEAKFNSIASKYKLFGKY